jgi:alpha-amylase
VPSPISWADEERDITAWQGNELQVAALDKLYTLFEKVKKCEDGQIKKDWEYLQSSDHFYYMATKFFSDGAVHAYFNPYETPYDAFMNYMNVLSDFEIRLNRCCPDSNEQMLISNLENLIREKEQIIEQQAAEIQKLTKRNAKSKGPGRPSSAGTPSTTLQELAHKLIEQSVRKGKAEGKKSVTAKTKVKAVKKNTPKKSLVNKKTAGKRGRKSKKTGE